MMNSLVTVFYGKFRQIDNKNFVLSRQSIKLFFCLVFVFFIASIPLIGIAQETYKEAIPVAENPEIEKRMLALTEDLRCLVCQNESIADSRADFSNDIRRTIRDQIQAGKNDAEIIDFLVDRYGDFVLYNPPMKPTTVLLWFGPLIFFIFSTWFLIKYLKGRREQVEEVSLTDTELKKAAALLDENDLVAPQHQKADHDNKQTESQQSKADASVNENKGNNI